MVTNYTEFITTLSSATGLDKSVLAAWIGRENGAYNNALGLTYQRGSSVPVGQYIGKDTYLGSFTSQSQAATETARWLNTFPQYAGIRNAAKSGTPAQQALAIANSPWRTGGSGTDQYYLQGFIDAGILGANASPGGGASTPVTNVSSGNTGLTDFQASLKKLGISDNPAHVFTIDEAYLVMDKIFNLKGYSATSGALFMQGKTVGGWFGSQSKDTVVTASNDPANTNSGIQLPNLDIPGALMFIAVILVGVTFLGLGGVVMLKGKK